MSFDNNVYYYYGENRKINSYITLFGAIASVTNNRQVYNWNNNSTKYQVNGIDGAVAQSIDSLKQWIKQTQPNILADETSWVVKGVKE
ncbi:hypothetical protein [Trichormus azollae]|uniref:hypothetical protein n=1 Tax=Trichormus azollae TaxID=1164 RepID=UPI00325CC7C7